ncbi:sensor histidine kinase [Oleiagrimonas soli]|uniref:Histidine kinase n=1 Tax=Oleiagrimonas soli TaxID=1543381 RepID=A0A099CSQ0_9GAMM|nr:histidine kinase [Oleiagrimonas soli]KGI76711.1 histidine kinase [Oleiagrimonas soli]MBB6185063.1 two-component system sensor histidine kinase AlgZ [Oleiagrimonas soli]
MNRSHRDRDDTRVPLPDLCSVQGLFALVLVAGITITVMQLAPGVRPGWRAFSVGMLFAVWLSIVLAASVCILRPWFERLPAALPYLAVWSWMLLMTLLLSALIGWIDHALRLGLTRQSTLAFSVVNGTLVALIAAALLRYFYVLMQWRARLAAVSRAQVQALQARIRPHFLFNSMNTVAALVRVDPGAAERTVEDLADLFRAALASDSEGTLGEELDLVDRYLDIEQRRLGDRLRVQRDIVDPPIDFTLPRLLLQPLVENAVRHGIQPSREGGTVRIAVDADEHEVRIAIDNSVPREPVTTLDEDGHGHGLHSVRERIAYHYGERGRLQVEDADGRYAVRVILPRGAA